MQLKQTELKQDLMSLRGLDQQRQQLRQKISELEALQEEIATRALNAPDTPHECYVQIDDNTIAWIEHSDNWDDGNLRSAIQFHDLQCLQ